MKLIAYLRVSSDGQLDGYGLDAQQSSVTAWCRTNGHRLVRQVSDTGISGATDALDRPEFSEVVAALAAGEADGLVVARLDRLARALTVQEATLAVLWRSGVEVFAADAGRVLRDDPDAPMRTALRQVVGVFSELERRLVVKRLRDGRAAKKALGRKSVGAYPFGYYGLGKGRNRDAAVHPAENQAAQEILRLRSAGLSYRQIARAMDERGMPPRRADRWSPMSVRNIVQRQRRHDSPADSARVRSHTR